MRKSILCFLLLFMFLISENFGQKNIIDSLKTEYDKAKHDTTRVNILNLLSEQIAYSNPDSFVLIAKQILDISERNLKSGDKEYERIFIRGKINAINNWGMIYSSNGKSDSSIILLNKAIELSKQNTDVDNLLISYNNLGQYWANVGNPDKARAIFKSLLPFTRYLSLPKQSLMIKNNYATMLLYNNQVKESVSLFEEILSEQKKIKDWEGYALTCNNLGYIYGNVLADKQKSENFLIASIESYEKTNQKKYLANAYTNYASIAEDKGDYRVASEFYFKALACLENQGTSLDLVMVYNNLGHLFKQTNDLEKAMVYTKKALEATLTLKDNRRLISIYNNLGSISQQMKKYDEALEYFDKARGFAEEFKEYRSLVSIYNNIGHSLERKNINREEAVKYFLLAIETGEKNGFEKYISVALNNYGVYLADSKKHKEAQKVFERSLKLSREIKDIGDQSYALNGLYNANYHLGNYKQAIEHLLLYKKLQDSLFNIENKKDILEKESRYTYELKEAKLKAEQDRKDLIAQREKEKVEFVRNSFIAGFVLMLLLAVIVYRSYVNKKKANEIISSQKQEVERKNTEIEHQKNLIEEKHKEITDSINYAERIQRSFLATQQHLNEHLGEYFIFFKPKDVVSGDFYWSASLLNGQFILATADSTGHGVPGAIMSLLNITSLEKAIEQYVSPDEILNHTRTIIIDRLKRDGSIDGGKDGMDCSLCVFDFKNKKLLVAAANNPVWIIRGDEIIEIKPDKMPVGKHDRQNVAFTLHEIIIQKGDVVYTLTDGFPDQFGGAKGKKFMSKNLRELLAKNAHTSLSEQKDLLENTFTNWVGDLEQIDDVTIIGIRV